VEGCHARTKCQRAPEGTSKTKGFNSVSSESIYRFEADLFYAGAGRFMDEVLRLVSTTTPPVRAIMFDASRISDVDYSAARTLLQMDGE
jgi:MFS superfamily sulfate permease-like transporter